MKTPISAAPTPSAPTQPTSPVRTAPTSPSTSIRPATAADYRANIERQSREQKSVGNILSLLVYGLIAIFVLGGGLAGYGIYTLSRQIQKQSVTIGDLDARYAAETEKLGNQLKTTMDTVSQEQEQLARQQDLILHQQESITKLLSANDSLAASLHDTRTALLEERAARAADTAALRARLSAIQGQIHEVYIPSSSR